MPSKPASDGETHQRNIGDLIVQRHTHEGQKALWKFLSPGFDRSKSKDGRSKSVRKETRFPWLGLPASISRANLYYTGARSVTHLPCTHLDLSLILRIKNKTKPAMAASLQFQHETGGDRQADPWGSPGQPIHPAWDLQASKRPWSQKAV